MSSRKKIVKQQEKSYSSYARESQQKHYKFGKSWGINSKYRKRKPAISE